MTLEFQLHLSLLTLEGYQMMVELLTELQDENNNQSQYYQFGLFFNI